MSQRTFKMVLKGTIYGSKENLSNQGSLKNHFLRKFFKKPIKVYQTKRVVLQ